MRARLAFGLVAVLAIGCGGKKIVPVSGKVTLNGKPLAGATVSFQPVAEAGTASAGPGSIGKTNENGEFALKASTGQDGAVTGKHRVIITVVAEEIGDGDARPPRGGWPQKEKLPRRYNEDSTETFDVPAGGTAKADFPLTSP